MNIYIHLMCICNEGDEVLVQNLSIQIILVFLYFQEQE